MDGGTHEITRAYYQGGRYKVAHDTDRLGQHRLMAVDVDEKRVLLSFGSQYGNYQVSVPVSRCNMTFRS